MNQNDQKIMELKKQIEIKKEILSRSEKFSPITNCSIEFGGKRHSIHVMKKDEIIDLMVKLNVHAMSARDLGLLGDYTISGYNITDWMKDLKAKLEVVSRKDEEAKLKMMETKLHKLLSEDKKVALELEEIESMLK